MLSYSNKEVNQRYSQGSFPLPLDVQLEIVMCSVNVMLVFVRPPCRCVGAHTWCGT